VAVCAAASGGRRGHTGRHADDQQQRHRGLT
jgi:hypothetical protein